MSAHPPLPDTAHIRARTALLLIGAVVLAHVLVLRSVSEHLPAHDGQFSTRVFSTRAVQIRPPAQAPAALPQRPVSLAPKPRPAPRPVPPARPKTDGVLAAAARPAEPPGLTSPPPVPTLPQAPVEMPIVVAESPPPPEPVPTPTQMPASAPAPVVDASAPGVALPLPVAPLPPVVARSEAATRPYTIPGSIRLAFDAVGKRGRLDYKAMGSLIWMQDGKHYDMRMEMGDWIIGKRVVSSSGELTASGLEPTRYSDKFRSERAAHFDRLQGRITFSANTAQIALLPGAQDQLSIFAQLASLVAGDPFAFPVGATVTIQTAGPRDAEPWLFVVEREEMLSLPGGQVPALKLVRSPNKDYDQKVELWLAPELAYLPARIKITFANGDYLDQQWKSSGPP